MIIMITIKLRKFLQKLEKILMIKLFCFVITEIVVDDKTQCPLKCPFGTALEGAYVMNLEICDIETRKLAQKKCPAGSDLEGVSCKQNKKSM